MSEIKYRVGFYQDETYEVLVSTDMWNGGGDEQDAEDNGMS